MNDCATWASLSDRAAVEETLTAEERLFLRSHQRACAECGAEAQLWSSLTQVLEEPERLTTRPAPAEAPQSASRAWARANIWLTAAALVTVAASATVWLWPEQRAPRPQLAAAKGLAPTGTAAQRGAGGARLALAAGRVLVDRREAVAGQGLALGSVLSVEEGQACVLAPPGVTACLESGTQLSVEALEPDRRRFRLHRGHVVAHLDRQPAGSTFGFETAAGSVVAKGTVFSLRSDGSAVTLRVHEGVVLSDQGSQRMPYEAPSAALLAEGSAVLQPVEAAADSRLVDLAKYFTDGAHSLLQVTAAAGSSVALGDFSLGSAPVSALLSPGPYRMEVSRPGFASIIEQLQMEPHGAVSRSYEGTPGVAEGENRAEPTRPRASGSSAGKLLEQARSLRGQGRYRESQGAYQRLLREHALSAEARVALVSLGELQLSQLGDARAALRSFEAYLRGGGALRQEASYGRIRALRRLGKSSEARAAAEAFVSAYPKSVQASTLRKELLQH